MFTVPSNDRQHPASSWREKTHSASPFKQKLPNVNRNELSVIFALEMIIAKAKVVTLKPRKCYKHRVVFLNQGQRR